MLGLNDGNGSQNAEGAPPTFDNPSPKPGGEFVVNVDRGANVGMIGLMMYDGMETITGVVSSIQNGPCTGSPLKRYDRVLSMNGISVSDPAMTQVLRNDRFVELYIKRPKHFTVKIKKEEGLGIKIGYGEQSELLVIREINEGAIRNLNNRYEDREIRKFDAIISVNGTTGNAGEMVQEIEDSSVLTLEMLRWLSKADLDEFPEEHSF